MILLLIILTSFIYWRIGHSVFEILFGTILITPVVAYGLSGFSPLDYYLYLTSFVLVALLALTLRFHRLYTHSPGNLLNEALPIIVFAAGYIFIHRLCLLWPDFIAMGERLRDYAILSSVIQSPIELKEPWMAGYPLNYYAFWYRFGHMLSVLFNLPTFEVYHGLQSFTFALFIACGFRAFHKYLGFSALVSLIFALMIAFGSNLSGVLFYLANDHNWWGPSRVITGAINEFPAWSFLLGDLHPHYLNLPLLPFLALLLLALRPALNKPSQVVICAVAAVITCSLWIMNANTWEVPVWLVILCAVGGAIAITVYLDFRRGHRPTLFSQSESFDWQTGLILIFLCFVTYSVFESQKNLNLPDYSKDWVKDPILRTPIREMGLHFGIPLVLISLAYCATLPTLVVRLFAGLSVAALILFGDALPFLLCLLGFGVFRFFRTIWFDSSQRPSPEMCILEACGLAAIGLIIVPEIVFLNDPYGAEIERMNTIFKIYSAAWFWIHLYCFSVIGNVFPKVNEVRKDWKFLGAKRYAARFAAIYLLPLGIGLILLTGFFRMTAFAVRRMPNLEILPYAQGLSEINRQFPGSAEAIKALLSSPRGITLEAQGKPYDYTTHIATLSEQPSYLGWANHVNLLLQNDPEVKRREDVSEHLYTEKNCAAKVDLLRRERISYVVLGPLEVKRYPDISDEDFSCLDLILNNEGYRLYRTPRS